MNDAGIKTTIAIIEKVAEEEYPDATANTMIDELSIDSLDLFTVIGDLEEETGRSMSDEEMGRVATIGDLVKHFYG
ncbi:phosphopantetheine-binding protein [Maricaulis sp.]|uniref:acyl carrier protein n=1 Tax=Maricaulis sp. TaxID=1486257 RepID=UPI00262F250E|nr:phosphopantetheine-binding protein [Maricaulis sp.]